MRQHPKTEFFYSLVRVNLFSRYNIFLSNQKGRTMKAIKALVVVAMFGIAGCASTPLVIDSTDQALAPPPANKAQIVFLNPSNSIGGAFLTGVYDVKNSDKEFLGMLGSKMKVVQNVEPGKHLFMAHTIAYAHFLDADVQAGKRYYVLLRFIYGRGLQLRPIRNSGGSEFSVNNPKFAEWNSESKFVVKTPDADAWYTKYKNAVDDAQTKGWADWQQKTPEQKVELTLNKEDHIEK